MQYKHVDVSHCGFYIPEVRVIPKSKTVLSGENYEAEIFLGTVSYTSLDTTFIGEYDSITHKMIDHYDSIPLSMGVSNYERLCKKPGKYELKGFIKNYVGCVNLSSYAPFGAEYEVVK